MAIEDIVITRKRGDLYPEEVTVVDKKTGLAKDITGNTFLLTVTSIPEPPDDSTKLFQLTGVITDALNGKVEFTPIIADAAIVGNNFYDVQLVGPKETVMSGPWNVTQDRTKD